MRGFGGRGSAAHNGQGIAVVQIVERLQRRRVILPQALRSALVCRVRAQIRFWCARARTLIASTSGLLPHVKMRAKPDSLTHPWMRA